MLILFLTLSTVDAQTTNTSTAFTTADNFSIPEKNGNINFAFNGAYTEAKLENGTWTFEGLVLNNSQAVQAYGFPDIQSLGNLKISAENSNVTVLALLSFNYSTQVDILSFTVEGWGTQTVNLCLNTTTRSVAEWSVLADEGATFLAEGVGWKLLDDNSVVVSDRVGNVTVMHYYLSDPSMANLSFLMQHYVIILVAVVLLVVVVVAVLITFRGKRRRKATFNAD